VIRRTRLSTLLVSSNIALLLLAVIGVSFVAARLLEQLANEQALARVAQAAINAQNAVARSSDDMLTDAQVLAARPTLSHYLVARDAPSLRAYLGQYCQASHLDACAVLVDGQVLAQTGPDLPWAALRAAGDRGSGRLLQRQPGGPLILGGVSGISTRTGAAVVVATLLDAAYERRLSAQITLSVAVLDSDGALASSAGPGAALRHQALTTRQAANAYLGTPPLYLAVLPLRAPSGDVVGVVQTTLPATSTLSALRQLMQTLLLLSLGVAVLSVLASFLVGRRLSTPLHMLTQAAHRIGGGDLVTPVPPAAGAEIGLLATTLEEMRERLLQMTGDLRKQRAEAEAIITGVVEGVFTVDRARRVRYMNPQAAALLGVAPEGVVGRFCGDVLHPWSTQGERPCEERCPIVHARFQGKATATERLALPEGRQRTVVITSAAPTDEQQVQVLRDETDLEATRRLRDTVLATISHEFRTPLSAQLASVELLLDKLPELSGEQIADLVHSLQRGTLRLTQLIDNLLESVRIEAGKDDMRRQSVALDEVLEEAADMIRPLLALRDQQLSMDLPYPLPAIEGDALRLRQVFVNLLANANTYAPAHSTIRIGGDVAGATIMLWVADAGPGFPGSGEDVLFERFVRARAGEPEQTGMGLGLWIAKSIVERHGGQVRAQNGTEGGAHLSVTLPVRDGSA
jgi:signal transduction histidine kinase